MTLSPFFQLHSDLPREGPGTADDVRWALSVVGPLARVCDAACGPGADTVVLAEALPEAQIDAVDGQLHFVAEARRRCTGIGDRVRVWQGDMADLTGPYDLIWCAGALYFLGVAKGLQRWRGALAPGGYFAFSEPVWVNGNSPQAALEFWGQYPDISDRAGIRARIAEAGYRVLGTRRVIGQGWADYFDPLEARIAALRQSAGTDLTAVLDAEAADIANWRAAPDHIAYDLFVVTPQ
ncbi:MAG: methyltransferase domain-containing protein [Rhodobacteraceae bacterium]|nr:methyltransferase domain-containing protein [Paracoccaceae bacterium]